MVSYYGYYQRKFAINPKKITMKTAREPTASAALVLDLFDGLNEFNLINSDDLQRLGITREQLLHVESRAPVSLIHKLWQCALEKKHPANIGLCIGQRLNPLARGLLSHLISHTENMGDALALFRDKSGLMSEAEKVKFSIQGGVVKVQYTFINPDHYHKLAIERSFSAALTWVEQLTGKNIQPMECGFRHKQVDYMAQCVEIFGDNILFNQQQDYMLFDASLMTTPVLNRNLYLKELLLKRAENVEHQMVSIAPLSKQVTNTIETHIAQGQVSVLWVAQQLNMSRQTLHRKLKKEDTHFSQLFTEVRKRLAQNYLAQPDLQIESLSEKLGFEEPSAFFKAFKSWFGMTPKGYQKMLTENSQD